MTKTKLFNMRVTEDWIRERREKMERSGYSSMADYVQAMIELGEGVDATIIRREAAEDE